MARKQRPDSRVEDCVRIDGELYDVRAWAPRHPGGDVLKHFFGRDATGAFAAFHSALARKMLKGMRARNLASFTPEAGFSADVEADFEALRTRAREAGLFESRRGWFYGHAAWTVGLIVASVGLLVWSPSAWPLAALALALGWQQCGWLAHDVLHNSVHEQRRTSELVGTLFGGVVLGFSGDWWKTKHNTHHALPNVRGVDTDIDTTPFLSFSESDLADIGPVTRWLVRAQTVTAIPVLAAARTNWVVASFLWALRAPSVPRRALELTTLALHLGWSFGMLALLPSWGLRIAFFVMAQLLSGLFIGSVFLVGHNARPMVERTDAPGFCELQCATTQNIRAPFGFTWFFGGLEHQIEHHLFPTMPRHNHKRIKNDVRALCEAHGLAYVERSFAEGLVDVARVLARVAGAARDHESSPAHASFQG